MNDKEKLLKWFTEEVMSYLPDDLTVIYNFDDFSNPYFPEAPHTNGIGATGISPSKAEITIRIQFDWKP